MQAAFEELAEVQVETAFEARGELEIGESGHMHGRLGGLEIEKRRVDARQLMLLHGLLPNSILFLSLVDLSSARPIGRKLHEHHLISGHERHRH